MRKEKIFSLGNEVKFTYSTLLILNMINSIMLHAVHSEEA